MILAKPALDVGLYTNNLDAMLAFWQEQAMVTFDELLKVGGGLHQYRHSIANSILKINHRREPVPQSTPSGLSALEISSTAVDESVELIDPDGNEVILTPARFLESANLCLHMRTTNLDRSAHFYGSILGLSGDIEQGFTVGDSRIKFSQGHVAPIERTAVGYRYMTMQVFDVLATHASILELGGTEAMAPVRLGDVAYISFVSDPDGNYIEISQRKSLTGSLE